MDGRAEGQYHVRQEQRAHAATKNVSAKFVVRFHSYTSVLRREPWVAVDPAGRGPGGALSGETPNELDAEATLPDRGRQCQYCFFETIAPQKPAKWTGDS